MPHYTETEIHDLIQRFEVQKLPKKEWTHEAHLVVAIWYCNKHPFEEALPLVRDYITRHNTSVGTPNTDTEGYHESITRFWLHVADGFLKKNTFSTIGEACNAFIKAPLAQSNYPLTYYSPAVLFSTEARHNWVTPDLKKLDSLASKEQS